MLLQTNSYIVPKEKRAEHSRLIRRFRQTLLRLGCDHFEVYEQVGANWSNSESAGRYVQILRFLDRKHQLAVQSAERTDPTAQAVIADFCDLINFPYQQQQGLFAVGFYTSVLPVAPKRGTRGELVSTVEHEVVDDPEAEKPYPGSSDGPPVEDAAVNEMGEGPLDESMLEEPIAEASEENFDEPLEEQTEFIDEAEEPVAHPVAHIAPEPMPEPIAAETSPSAVEPHIPEVENHTDSTDDFMNLVSGDSGGPLSGEPAELLEEDDSANGFLEVDFDDELEDAAHPHSAKHHDSK